MPDLFVPFTLEEMRELFPGVSARTLKEVSQKLNCVSKIGRAYFWTVEDVEKLLMGVRQWGSRSKSAANSGGYTELSPVNALDEARELLAKKQRDALRPKLRRVGKRRRSTEQIKRPHSLTLV